MLYIFLFSPTIHKSTPQSSGSDLSFQLHHWLHHHCTLCYEPHWTFGSYHFKPFLALSSNLFIYLASVMPQTGFCSYLSTQIFPLFLKIKSPFSCNPFNLVIFLFIYFFLFLGGHFSLITSVLFVLLDYFHLLPSLQNIVIVWKIL